MAETTPHRDATAVLVFAKAPQPGAVKTRLIPGLGAVQAAALYRCMLEHALGCAAGSRLGPVILCCAPDVGDPTLRALARRFGARLTAQRGADLGMRMHNALVATLSSFPQAVLIGSDCPGLGAHDLRAAARALAAGSSVVLGPAVDGGYVLLAAKVADARLFRGVDWGSGRVLRQTRARLRALGWTWSELRPFRDVDRMQDLDLLPARLQGWQWQ